jgi:hypothetical protein
MLKWLTISTCAVITALLCSCSDGTKSQTLSRETALKLLQDNPQVWKADANNDLSFIVPINERIGNQSQDGYQGQINRARMAFMQDLVKAGVITIRSQGPSPYPAADGPGATQTVIAAVTQPDVTTDNTPSYSGAGTVRVMLTNTALKEVTGIQQEGTNAVAIVEVEKSPTAAYHKIIGATVKEMALCRQVNMTMAALFEYCGEIPDVKATTGTQSFQVAFARFDDGWRIVR